MNKAGPSSATDFDFLIGKWHVQNRTLVGRLLGSNDWKEFPATLDVRQLLAGLANMDQFQMTINGDIFEGVSVRVFNPTTGLWTIYWMDTNHPELAEQAAGTFKDGVGEFFGEEILRDKKVKVRFIWSDIATTSARWEQAYFDQTSDEWETNWIMEFTRAE